MVTNKILNIVPKNLVKNVNQTTKQKILTNFNRLQCRIFYHVRIITCRVMPLDGESTEEGKAKILLLVVIIENYSGSLFTCYGGFYQFYQRWVFDSLYIKAISHQLLIKQSYLFDYITLLTKLNHFYSNKNLLLQTVFTAIAKNTVSVIIFTLLLLNVAFNVNSCSELFQHHPMYHMRK